MTNQTKGILKVRPFISGRIKPRESSKLKIIFFESIEVQDFAKRKVMYDGSESPILRNSTLFHTILISFHATRNSFHTIPNLFHATRNLFRATPNMFPLILHLVCNICKNNFHHQIWSWNLSRKNKTNKKKLTSNNKKTNSNVLT